MIYYYIDTVEMFTGNITRNIIKVNGEDATVFLYEENSPYYQEVIDWIDEGNTLEEYVGS